MRQNQFPIRRLKVLTEAEVHALAALTIDCVEGGASIGFMRPLSPERARAYWRGLADDVAAGHRLLLVAEDATGICGTVQLILAMPDNQPHRADLAKMQVHSRMRGRGLGAALLKAVEDQGRAAGKTLLVLDTVTGSAGDRLYARHGWQRVGEIPGFALWPGGGLCPTTFFYRRLD
jgi:GNAT superfamily N-acetyltransferase